MIVCIPLRAPLADGERDAPVEPHLPRARYLHLYDTEARSGRTLDLSQLGQTESFRIEALLCTSLDRMTLRQLLQRGIRVYGTDAETLLDAIGQFERGELVAVVAAAVANPAAAAATVTATHTAKRRVAVAAGMRRMRRSMRKNPPRAGKGGAARAAAAVAAAIAPRRGMRPTQRSMRRLCRRRAWCVSRCAARTARR